MSIKTSCAVQIKSMNECAFQKLRQAEKELLTADPKRAARLTVKIVNLKSKNPK
ncbi:MAG: hypothetical protein IKB20_01240 [Clostridia bacterium]|nr:hypothetical protein [Clostridia bacterium]